MFFLVAWLLNQNTADLVESDDRRKGSEKGRCSVGCFQGGMSSSLLHRHVVDGGGILAGNTVQRSDSAWP